MSDPKSSSQTQTAITVEHMHAHSPVDPLIKAHADLSFIKSELCKKKISANFFTTRDPAEDLASIEFDDAMLSQPSFQTLLHLTALRFRDLQQDSL